MRKNRRTPPWTTERPPQQARSPRTRSQERSRAPEAAALHHGTGTPGSRVLPQSRPPQKRPQIRNAGSATGLAGIRYPNTPCAVTPANAPCGLALDPLSTQGVSPKTVNARLSPRPVGRLLRALASEKTRRGATVIERACLIFSEFMENVLSEAKAHTL